MTKGYPLTEPVTQNPMDFNVAEYLVSEISLTNNNDPEKYNFYNEKNNKYVKDVFDKITSLPKLDVISQAKLYGATFEEIPVRKTDNGENKKFLRKMNVRF